MDRGARVENASTFFEQQGYVQSQTLTKMATLVLGPVKVKSGRASNPGDFSIDKYIHPQLHPNNQMSTVKPSPLEGAAAQGCTAGSYSGGHESSVCIRLGIGLEVGSLDAHVELRLRIRQLD